MGIYLIADPHLGHEKVAGIRGFSSSAEHDAWFFRNWEKAVSEGDTVYVLGDLVFGMHKYELLEQLGSLPGTKYLIRGNHDRCHPSMRQAITFEAKIGRYFDGVASSGFLKFNGREFLLSHFPYQGDHTEGDRFTQWRLPDLGTALIHGHTHSTELLSRSDKGTTQVCVSVDAVRGTPRSLGTLVGLVEEFEKDV